MLCIGMLQALHNGLSFNMLLNCVARQVWPYLLKHGICLVNDVAGQFQGAAATEVRHELMPLLLDPDGMVLLAAIQRKELFTIADIFQHDIQQVEPETASVAAATS